MFHCYPSHQLCYSFFHFCPHISPSYELIILLWFLSTLWQQVHRLSCVVDNPIQPLALSFACFYRYLFHSASPTLPLSTQKWLEVWGIDVLFTWGSRMRFYYLVGKNIFCVCVCGVCVRCVCMQVRVFLNLEPDDFVKCK